MMAASPPFKVYDSHGLYQAATREVEAAACLMGLYGNGATIRYGHNKIVWLNGPEADGDATNSYDDVGATIYARLGRA